MAKKKTLPKDFAQLCRRSGITEFAALFADTDTNATERGSLKTPALSFAELTIEQMRWLLEHGADTERCDHFGDTPLIAHAKHAASEQAHQRLFDEEGLRFDAPPQQSLAKITLLLDNGADIHARNRADTTALHAAAVHPKPSACCLHAAPTSRPAIGQAIPRCTKPVSTPKPCAFCWNTAPPQACRTMRATPRWKPRCAKPITPMLRR